jgi:hypothetical protein
MDMTARVHCNVNPVVLYIYNFSLVFTCGNRQNKYFPLNNYLDRLIVPQMPFLLTLKTSRSIRPKNHIAIWAISTFNVEICLSFPFPRPIPNGYCCSLLCCFFFTFWTFYHKILTPFQILSQELELVYLSLCML